MSEWVARKRNSLKPVTELWFRARGEDSVFIKSFGETLEIAMPSWGSGDKKTQRGSQKFLVGVPVVSVVLPKRTREGFFV